MIGMFDRIDQVDRGEPEHERPTKSYILAPTDTVKPHRYPTQLRAKTISRQALDAWSPAEQQAKSE